MKVPDAKAAVDKEWKKLEAIPAWNLEKKLRAKKRSSWNRKETKKVHFATLMDKCHLQNGTLMGGKTKIGRISVKEVDFATKKPVQTVSTM